MALLDFVRFAVKSLTSKPRMLAAGTPAPPLETADVLGRPVSLNALRGRKVVLWFFPKADTPG